MFAVNGPSGPTSRYERRVRNDAQPTEQLDEQKRKREAFFQVKPKSASVDELTSRSNGKGRQMTNEKRASQIFKGCRIYFNGRTGNVSSYYLTKLVEEHGGNMAREFKVTRVTHIVAMNLSGAKADKLIKSCGKIKCVQPEWILQSVKQGKKLAEFDFLVYKDTSARVLNAALTQNAVQDP